MTAIAYEHCRYRVTSEHGREPYLVDLMEHKCDCDDFRIRVDARKEKPECKHLRVAYEQFGRDMIDLIRKQTGRGRGATAQLPRPVTIPFRSKS